MLELASDGVTNKMPHAVVYDPVDLRIDGPREPGTPLRVGMVGRIAPVSGASAARAVLSPVLSSEVQRNERLELSGGRLVDRARRLRLRGGRP